jgi:hypothetical protein
MASQATVYLEGIHITLQSYFPRAGVIARDTLQSRWSYQDISCHSSGGISPGSLKKACYVMRAEMHSSLLAKTNLGRTASKYVSPFWLTLKQANE